MNGEGIPDILLKRTLIKCKNRRSWPDKSAYHMPYDTVYVYGAVPTTPVSLETFTGDGPWASGHTMCVRMHAYRRSGRTRTGYSYRRSTVRCGECRAACIYNIRYRLFLHLIKVLFNKMSGIPSPFIFYQRHFEEISVNFLCPNLKNPACTGIF